ncbi:hypothetical protein RvY_04470-2 [Ramazzottius varieornatus]|uniref:Uncharacterized protein n=1 Tax=Ramazzottius varieornatus TaxID=947166 RepID=A0A1D1URS3_RAMVA|nr:hypothetical protein RvY_04470-2 [Ramazzottius varieornatus]
MLFKIGSRTIKKFVSRNYTNELADINQTATEFVAEAKLITLAADPTNAFNMDQSSFNYEMHRGRNLHYRGAKNIEAGGQSINSTTHSFMIQPVVSMSGEWKVTASSSGTVTKELLRKFFERV